VVRDPRALNSRGARTSAGLLDSTARALAKPLLSYLRRVAARAAASGFDDFEGMRAERGTVFFCYRNQDVLALAVALCLPAAERAFRGVELVHDDSFWGLLSAGLAQGLGYAGVTLHRAPFGRRAHDVLGLMRSPRSLGIAVDPGGPYGRVPDSLPELARRCGARLVPIVALADRTLPVRMRPSLRLPVPGSRIAIAASARVAAGDANAREDVQLGFDRAEQRARERLREAAAVAPER
jgi:hypothetical protein